MNEASAPALPSSGRTTLSPRNPVVLGRADKHRSVGNARVSRLAGQWLRGALSPTWTRQNCWWFFSLAVDRRRHFICFSVAWPPTAHASIQNVWGLSSKINGFTDADSGPVAGFLQ
jgi:hypothetical protein